MPFTAGLFRVETVLQVFGTTVSLGALLCPVLRRRFPRLAPLANGGAFYCCRGNSGCGAGSPDGLGSFEVCGKNSHASVPVLDYGMDATLEASWRTAR
jgi:hypothetical protein